jgi:hypothetical protein
MIPQGYTDAEVNVIRAYANGGREVKDLLKRNLALKALNVPL